MWRLIDSNKIVATKCKVESYKTHLQNLQNMKPGVRIEKPWMPSFSLSKRHNKHKKFLEEQISKQNENLLARMIKIETDPMRTTINIIPANVPSNSATFLETKSRERKASTDQIRRENSKILDRLTNTNSDYNRRVLSNQWKGKVKYRENLLKKEHVADYSKLAKQELELGGKSRVIRPRTAFTQLQRPNE